MFLLLFLFNDLNSLITEYRNYINWNFTPVDWSSKSIYEEIERSIKTITQKEQIEVQLISESKNKLKVLLSSLQWRLDKWEKNVIKNVQLITIVQEIVLLLIESKDNLFSSK